MCSCVSRAAVCSFELRLVFVPGKPLHGRREIFEGGWRLRIAARGHDFGYHRDLLSERQPKVAGPSTGFDHIQIAAPDRAVGRNVTGIETHRGE